MARLLTAIERTAALADLPDWQLDADGMAISRPFRFADFRSAFGFMTQVALLAEAADHHPDWSNSYATVTIRLSTHSAGGVSDKDIALATAIDRIVAVQR